MYLGYLCSREKLIVKDSMSNQSANCFKLEKIEEDGHKPYYVIVGTEARKAGDAAYDDLFAAYGMNTASVNKVLRAVKRQLDSPDDSMIIRLDVVSCYESIDYGMLRQLLVADNRLSETTMATLDNIVGAYLDMGAERGMPRGVKLTNLLIEIYFEAIDNRIKAMPGLQLYRRYVDDSIAFFSPLEVEGDAHMLFDKIAAVYNDFGLTLHDPDEFPYKGDIFDTKKNCELSMLGYEIVMDEQTGKSVWRMPEQRSLVMMFGVKHIFDVFIAGLGNYGAAQTKSDSSLLSALLASLRNMTSNHIVKLKNGRKIKRGLAFSCNMLTTTLQLQVMDSFLQKQIERITADIIPQGFMATGTRHSAEETAAYLRRRCAKFKFMEGYTRYRFSDAYDTYLFKKK